MFAIWYRWNARRALAPLWVALVALSASAGPVRADMFRPSARDQMRLGDQAAEQVMRKYRVLHDDRARRVEDVGHRLLDAQSPKERGPWNYRFYLIESKDVNAFALPGGNVFIFTGLYDRMNSEDELAAVMAHELTHVREEHWADQAAAQQKRQLGLLAVLGLTRAGRNWQNAAGLVDNLMTLRYSRKDEDQADSQGLANIVDAGYNPKGMIDLFQTLQKSSGGAGGGPSFLRDHPLTKDRVRKTEERIDRLGSRNFRQETPLPQ